MSKTKCFVVGDLLLHNIQNMKDKCKLSTLQEGSFIVFEVL
jgi:hypothetical protein